MEIDKFANKTKEEKIEFLNNIKEIVKHNQKVFLDYSFNKNYELDCIKIVDSLTGKDKLIS